MLDGCPSQSLPPGANRTAVRLPVAFGRTKISIPARLGVSKSLNHFTLSFAQTIKPKFSRLCFARLGE